MRVIGSAFAGRSRFNAEPGSRGGKAMSVASYVALCALIVMVVLYARLSIGGHSRNWSFPSLPRL
jgi:hypothetical protein